MGRYIEAISDGAHKMCRAVAIFALFVLVVTVSLQVVARYIFFSPPTWTEELSRYAMIWMGLLGATMSFKLKYDPVLAQSDHSSALTALIFKVVQSAVVLVFLLPIAWYIFFGPGMRWDRGFIYRHIRTTADTLEISTIYVAISLPIAFAVILIHLAARWTGEDNNNNDPLKKSEPSQ